MRAQARTWARVKMLLLEQRRASDAQAVLDDRRRFASPAQPTEEPRQYSINGRLLMRLWRLSHPYFSRRDAWPSWTLLGLLVLTAGGLSGVAIESANVVERLTNAVVDRDAPALWPLVWTTMLLAALIFGADQMGSWIHFTLNQHWRRWFTDFLVQRYLAHRTYFDIAVRQDLDNPDQRLESEVAVVTEAVSTLFTRFSFAAAFTVAGTAILSSVSFGMGAFALVHAALSTLGLFLLYRPTVKMLYLRTQADADVRYSLAQVGQHAESVAMYRGEALERQAIEARLGQAFRRSGVLAYWGELIEWFDSFARLAWTLGPTLLLAPLYFDGQITYGGIAKGVAGASALVMAFNTVKNYLPWLAAVGPSAIRLAELMERHDRLAAGRGEAGEQLLVLHEAGEVAADALTLQTPGGERELVRGLSFRVQPGESLVIVGPSGVGKSSLLRALAGLWTRGQGRVTVPPPGEAMFLPQKPYMVLANLRSQLLYPNRQAAIDDAQIQRVLEQVRLPDLIATSGSLDVLRDWERVLSLGEQQRIAVARALLAKPHFLFLDEATSAMDLDTEAEMYRLLLQAGITCISVGHRSSILGFHDWVLALDAGGGWQWRSAAEAAIAPRAPGR